MTSRSSKALANDYDSQAIYSDSSATKTYTAKSFQAYSPIPVSQACLILANLSAKSRIGKFFFAEYLSMNGTDPRSTQKTNMKGHPDSPLSSNICKHPSIHPSFYSNSSPSQSIGDGQKGSAFILEYLKDPQTAFSDEPTDTLFHCVFDIDVPLWEWYELPEQSYRGRRFGVAMHGIGLMQPH